VDQVDLKRQTKEAMSVPEIGSFPAQPGTSFQPPQPFTFEMKSGSDESGIDHIMILVGVVIGIKVVKARQRLSGQLGG
jgi:hypothetical protein